VDTPGLLDRPLDKRNPIELQAITALKYLAQVILYIVDPSETCGYLLKDQISLYKDLKELFGDIYLVLNKIDLIDKSRSEELREIISDECFKTNALTGNGVNETIDRIIDANLMKT
jgi:nucleolar GTP-binding protein